jgi:guanylate kinase
LDKVEYKSSQEKVIVICPKHGEFMGTPDALLQGKGCPKCGNHLSRGEDEIYEYIKSFMGEENVVKGDKKVLGGLEIDILIPSKQIGFEFDGLRWHSEKYKNKYYHLNKTERCKENGIVLIHIFEDEWLYKKEIVLNKIKHILGFNGGKKIGARKCSIKKIDKKVAKEFLDKNHIQGYIKSTEYFGAFYGNNLVGVMSFLKEKDGFILNRFATNRNFIIQGLFSKMLTHFIENYNPQKIETFLDRRWSHGNSNVYEKMRFSLTETLPPDYRYVVKNQRLHKFGFRKQILAKKYNLPLSMTEREMTEKLGFYRIWDCGLYKYVWKR